MIKLMPSLLFCVFMHSPVNAEQIAFGSMQDFAATLPKAKLLDTGASGTVDVDGTNTTIHAQLVELDDAWTQQIFIFRLNEGGKYVLLDQSKRMQDMGGSGNWRVRGIAFRHASLYVSFGYGWHQCSGWSEAQFRVVNGRLAMIGNESEEENAGEGLTVRSSTNLLTGEGYWVSEKNGAVKKHLDKSIKGAKPFSAYDGSGWISPYHTKHRVC